MINTQIWKLLVVTSICLSLFSCAKKNLPEDGLALDQERIKKIDLDTMVIDGNDPDMVENTQPKQVFPYRAAFERKFDLIHTKLDLKFDFSKQWVIGIVELTLKPYFFAQKQLVLDAKGMDVNSIKNSSGVSLKFVNNGSTIEIDLEKPYNKNEELKLIIDYIAKPEESGGSAAITSDKGLFFINPMGEEADKPTQIWTQGETENNSRWFPTIDKPNERCTQELTLTVPDKFRTLSNGIMTASKKNADGTRTDTWKQDKPHAPYLFMIAVGEYAVVKDKWQNIPLEYLVEPKYEPFAKEIFNHTPEMLQFFSDKLNYKYPWDKYSQVITRDYVSGAMENTTAVIFGEFVQKTDRELIDNHNDAIVAHEMFHHWFGDLVTCESWSNLTLNEGFANYSEYLWLEHKYGKDRADEHRFNEMGGYLSSAQEGVHPLIHFRYADKENMFDAHSYNKGGLVLHMLRTYLGDEAFYASLNYYLNENKYTAVEVDELRIAFEEVTGQDLNWFFDQWYLTEGHPILDHTYTYDATSGKLTNIVKQNQENPFKIPFDLAAIAENGKISYHKVWIENAIDTFIVQLEKAPAAVVLDGRDDILAEVSDTSTTLAGHFAILQYSPEINHRQKAMNDIASFEETDFTSMVNISYADKHHSLKSMAIGSMNEDMIKEKKVSLLQDAKYGEHSNLRQTAIDALSTTNNIDKETLIYIIENEKAYPVVNAAILGLQTIDQEEALQVVEKLAATGDDNLLESISAIYSGSKDPAKLDWYLNTISKVDIGKSYTSYQYLLMYLRNTNQEAYFTKAKDFFYADATNMKTSIFKRYMATSVIKGMLDLESAEEPVILPQELVKQLKDSLVKIKAKETNPMLIERYSQF